MQLPISLSRQVWQALLVVSLVSIGLWGVGAWRNQTIDFWYLPFNLFLGCIPLVFSSWLQKLLQTHPWSRPLPLVVTVAWLLFLPNSFYIVTDFIHLTEQPRVDIVQDVVMLTQFSLVGLAIGYFSLSTVHREFARRISKRWAPRLAALVILLCSFAVYLGRELRWNSWDVVVQPLALIRDVLAIIFNPMAHSGAIIMTLSFFVMLGSFYYALWWTGRSVRSKE